MKACRRIAGPVTKKPFDSLADRGQSPLGLVALGASVEAPAAAPVRFCDVAFLFAEAPTGTRVSLAVMGARLKSDASRDPPV